MLLTSPWHPPLQVNVNGAPSVLAKLPPLRLGVLPPDGRESLKSSSEPVMPSCTVPLPSSHHMPLPLPSPAMPQLTFAVQVLFSRPRADVWLAVGSPWFGKVTLPRPPLIVAPVLHSVAGQSRVVTAPSGSLM